MTFLSNEEITQRIKHYLIEEFDQEVHFGAATLDRDTACRVALAYGLYCVFDMEAQTYIFRFFKFSRDEYPPAQFDHVKSV